MEAVRAFELSTVEDKPAGDRSFEDFGYQAYPACVDSGLLIHGNEACSFWSEESPLDRKRPSFQRRFDALLVLALLSHFVPVLYFEDGSAGGLLPTLSHEPLCIVSVPGEPM